MRRTGIRLWQQSTMLVLWGRLGLLLAACVAAAAAAGEQDKVLGALCSPGQPGTWGVYCKTKSFCAGATATNSNRCLAGQTPPPPRIVCCAQSGPAPPEAAATPQSVVATPQSVVATRKTRKPYVWTARTKSQPPPTATPSTPSLSTPVTMEKPGKKKPPVVPPMHANKSSMVQLPTSKDAKRIAMEKCAAYSEYVYKLSYVNTLLPGEIIPVRERDCLMLGEALISGGTKAKKGEFPHMVALGFSVDDSTYSWLCGGSLISENFVLTAGHCTYTYHMGGSVKRVLLGATQLTDPSAILRDVVAIIKHPAYAAPAHYNDIALLKLAGELKFSSSMRPACIGMEHYPAVRPGKHGAAFDVTGWGLNVTDGETLPDLMKVDLYLAPFEMCDEFYKFLTGGPKLLRGIDRKSMLCIQNIDTSKDSCQGDSGGPVQSKMSEPYYCMYNVAGLTSFGVSSCGGGTLSASLYTNVRHYLPWIVSVVWPEEVAKRPTPP